MALSTRHRWCVAKIVEAFAPDVDDPKVQAFIRQEENNQKFTALFRGDPGAPTKLFVYYQPPSSSSSASNNSGSNNNNNVITPASGDSNSTYPTKSQPELILSEGETDEALSRKCCYFLRNVPAGQAIDTTKEGEQDLLFGELSGHPLSSIESILSYCYKPLFEAAEANVWGRADEEHRADFMGEMDHFIHNLTEALKSLAGGLELRHPDSKIMEEIDAPRGGSGATMLAAKANRNPELFAHFEGLLEEWCNQIESYLEAKQGGGAGGKESNNNNAADGAELDEGPKGELDYWRNR